MSGGSELKRLPPRLALQPAAAREQKAAQVRGVESIHWMREAIRDAARALPRIAEVPRAGKLDGAAFRARAAAGLPFLLSGVVKRWPLCALTPQDLRERFGDVPVRARVGDYVATAFAADRAMQDMSLRAYLDLSLDQSLDPGAEPAGGLPPYVGNLELRELNAMCHWPTYFEKMGPPRFWLGPARTVTPLHCDYDDNIFAQVWGTKRIFLAPPHHDAFLYAREANPVLFGSPFDPEAPNYDAFPLARQAAIVEVVVKPGDMLYVPAGWYHQVRALTFSLSSNRWARGMPLALQAASRASASSAA
jgi:hypothetical protein